MRSIKRTLLVISFLLSINYVSAQKWKEMMDDPKVNIYDVVEEAELYFQKIDRDAKGSGWKAYQRWLFENEPKFYPSGDRSYADPYFVSKAYTKFLTNNPSPARALFDNGWEELGPYYIEQVTGHYSLGLGRVESFYSDPNDSLRIYLGSRSGGFWKTLDGGATWTGNTTDSIFASGINTMTVSPTNSDSILINVRNSRNSVTHGIYRSGDAGDTWTVTNFNPTNLGWGGLGTNDRINHIAYHPTVPNLVFISTSQGLFRSTDDLATWTSPISSTAIYQIEFHPANPNIIYAREWNDSFIYRSTDGGVTFSQSNTIPGSVAGIKMSTTADCPSCVYVGSSNGIWKSVDNGMNFSLVSTPGINLYGAFAVSDVDTNYMLFGNIDVNMSTDGGKTFYKTTYWAQGNANYATNTAYVHADIRGSKCINGVFWVNTDGFLGHSYDNGVTWEIFEGYSIRENYSLGVSQSNHFRTICGSQDNGTSIKTENSWIEFFGADGMEGIIHPLNDDWMIGSVQYGSRRRTLDGGISQTGATPPGQAAGWIAPLFYDPNDPMVVYSLGDTLHRSENFGFTWTKLGTPSFTGSISEAAMAENNSDIIVVSKNANIEISVDGGNTFIDIQGTLPNNYIVDIAFDPNDESVIIVVYNTYQNNGQKVFITKDLGSTWQNITYNLNDMPVQSVVIDHTDASTIYLGAEIGVYKKAMADSTWSLYNSDLPNTTIYELEIMHGSNTLRAVTWGRGLWEYTLDGRQGFPSILTTQITSQPTDLKPRIGVDQYVTSTISSDSTITSAYIEWSINTPVFGKVISMSNTIDSTWVSDSPIPDQAVGTKVYFKVFAVGTSSDTTETYKFMYEVKPFDYCEALGAISGINLYIEELSVSTVTNTTGNNSYTYYAGMPITMTLDSTYLIFIDGYPGWASNDYGAWIDYNHNAEFDSNEVILLDTNAGSPVQAYFTIPSNANILDTLRLRVRLSYWGTSPNTCGIQIGEVEDYPVIIKKTYWIENVSMSICSTDSIFLEGKWQNSAGIYNDTVYIAAAADSIYITTLTTIIVDTSVTIAGSNITSNATGATYQWLDCDSGHAIITGATNKTYTITADGTYAVRVTQNGCVNVSSCYSVSVSEIIENDFGSNLVVYPNPTTGAIVVELGASYSSIHVKIRSTTGQLVSVKEFENSSLLNFDVPGSTGYYFVEIVATDDKRATIRILKE